MKSFQEIIVSQIHRFTRQQAELFSYLCIIRVLPFLNPWINIIRKRMQNETVSNESTSLTYNSLQRQLYSIFKSIDIILSYHGRPTRTSHECEVAYATRGDIDRVTKAIKSDNQSAAYVTRAISIALENTNLYLYGSRSSYADVAICACKAVEEHDQLLLKSFEHTILEDIDAIKHGNINKLCKNASSFDKLWNVFFDNLISIGCKYWADFYEKIYKTKFYTNKSELKKRLSVPGEIKDQGAKMVGKYLARLGDNYEKLNEARIIILGEKGAGKTSISRRLIDIDAEMPKDYESTEGVVTSIWTFPDNDGKDMNAHIWDFAGHSITHSAHRCFMSTRCIYIYVYNGRVERDNDPVYWLEQIRIHGGDSDILFLINEKDDHCVDIAKKTLKREYPSIRGYYHVDIGNDDKKDLEDFRQTVIKMVRNNPSWNNQVISEGAYVIKNYLREFFSDNKVPHITYENFCEIAEESGVAEEHITGILEDLHALGLCFWYKKVELTKLNTLVINPDWITNAIYRIINVGFIQSKCLLTTTDGTKILEKDVRYKYPRDKVVFLFHLMQEYELAFFKTIDSIFIPGILPIDEPDDLPIFNDVNDRLTMSFVVEKVLPPNICTRVIVHRNEFGEIFDENLLWRKGVVLKSNRHNAIALVIETGRSITVRVKGEGKTGYLVDLRETLRNIFDSYKTLYPKLLYEILEPIASDVIDNSDLTLRETPLLLSEEEITACLRKNRSYFDFANGRFISLDMTEENYQISVKRDIPFLFVTANENEKEAFKKRFIQKNVNYVKGAPYSYGIFGNYVAAWFHMASQGTSNADATILCGDIIKEVSPLAVIMVGIAFGVDENTQKIGDVLVSKYILNYDSRKEREGSSLYKEPPKEVGFQLLNAFRTYSSGFLVWDYPLEVEESEKFSIIEGAILTGSALIDDYDFRKKLLLDFAHYEPVGGEMEGYGIYSQCRSNSVSEWIIVKAICDWGHNKQTAKKDEWQKIAADSAVNFCHCVFSLRGGNNKAIFDDLVNK